MKNKFTVIKSLAAMLLVLVLALSCACGPEKDGDATNAPDSTPTAGENATDEPVELTPLPEIELPDDEFIIPEGDGVNFLVNGTTSTAAAEAVSETFRASYLNLTAQLLAECQDGNTFISPLSIATALQMTACGAKGDTYDEMVRLLGGGTQDLTELNRQLRNFYAGLSSKENAKFHSANAIWFTNRQDFRVNTAFLKLVKETFAAQIATAPLTEKGTIDAINKWCSENTDGMIPEVIENLSEDCVMVLLNALCFDALWSEKYTDNDTAYFNFNGTDGAKNAKFLRSREYLYYSGSSEQAFMKYYEGGDYSFMAVLPEEGTDIEAYVKGLTGAKLLAIIDGMEHQPVNTYLPEFSMDCEYRLPETLSKLGMPTAFIGGLADFSGLGKMDNGDPLYISDVIHKTHLEVDQSGTRAAAVTAVIMEKVTSVLENPIPEIRLDRPFVFAIVDNNSHLPIFIGSCLNVEE